MCCLGCHFSDEFPEVLKPASSDREQTGLPEKAVSSANCVVTSGIMSMSAATQTS